MGGIQRLLTPLGAQDGASVGEGAVLGAYICGALGVGVTGEREDGVDMWGLSSVLLYSSKQWADILGRLISPTSSSTLMQKVLRSRVRRKRKCIGGISYSAAQSTLDRFSLALCCTRDSRYSTRSWVSNHMVSRRAVRPSDAAYASTRMTRHGTLLTSRSCGYFSINRRTLIHSALSHGPAFPRSFSSAVAV